MTSPLRTAIPVLLLLLWGLSVFSCSAKPKHPEGWRRTVFYNQDMGATIAWRAEVSYLDVIDYEPLEDGITFVDKDAVYVGGRSRYLYRFDRLNGKLLKKKKLEEEIFSQPAIKGDKLYLGTSSGKVLAMNKESFADLWEYNAKSEIVAPVVIADDKLYFITQNDKLVSLERKTGKFIWEHREEFTGTMSIRRHARPVVSGDFLYQGFTNGSICAFERHTGKPEWCRNLGKGKRFEDVNATPFIDDDGMLYTASFDNGVYCLNAKSGIVVWYTPLKSASSPIVIGDRIYLTASEDGFYCLEKETGKIDWFMEFDVLFHGQKEGALSRPVLYQERYLVFTSSGSGVYFIDYLNEQLVDRLTPGLGVSTVPTVKGDLIYALSNGGQLYAFALARKGSPFAPYRKSK